MALTWYFSRVEPEPRIVLESFFTAAQPFRMHSILFSICEGRVGRGPGGEGAGWGSRAVDQSKGER